MNLREQVLNANDINIEPIEVPEWGNARLGIRVLGSDEIERIIKDDRNDVPFGRARMLAACLVDPETGKPIFSTSDVEKLAKKNWLVLKRVSDAALKHNGLDDKAVEDAEKNSPETNEKSSGTS